MQALIKITIVACAAVFVATAADARRNKGGPCMGATTSLSVNNPKCKPKNPPPVMADDPDDPAGPIGHGGKDGGKGSGGGGKGRGGGGGGGGKGGGKGKG